MQVLLLSSKDQQLCCLRACALKAPSRPLLGKRPASQANDLDGADDSPRILAINAFERYWIPLGQFLQQDWQRSDLQFAPELGIGCGRIPKTFEQSLKIESSPAAKDGRRAAALNVRNRLGRKPHKTRRVETF